MTDPSNTLRQLKKLLTDSIEGALGTLDEGRPFVSSVGYIWDESESGHLRVYFLLSDLARHAQHLKNNPSVSLLVTESAEHKFLYEKQRVTLNGFIELVQDESEKDKLKKKYLVRYPKAEIFFTLKDFKFYQLIPSNILWIGGFGKAEVIRCSID